jgi:hypothetical protein
VGHRREKDLLAPNPVEIATRRHRDPTNPARKPAAMRTTPGARVNQQICHRGPERRPRQWEITNDLSSPANPEIVATKGYLYSPRAENLTRVTSPTFGPFGCARSRRLRRAVRPIDSQYSGCHSECA